MGNTKTLLIDYAEPMKRKEIQAFYQSLIKLNESKQNAADVYFHKNKNLLINAYYEYEEVQIMNYQTQKRELLAQKELWSKKICGGCGSKLRLVDSSYGKFWGCPGFRDKSVEHITFPTNYGEIFASRYKNVKVRINAHWATDIIRMTNSSKNLKAAQLVRLYGEEGMEDLRKKYGYKSTLKSISGYVTAKKNSFREESEITNALSEFFPKSKTQLGIRYRLKDEYEKVAIIDFVLSDDQVVYLIEIKRRIYDIQIEQLELYFALMDYIMKEADDDRDCKGILMVYSEETYGFTIDEKYIAFESVRNKASKLALKSIFNKNAEIMGR